MPLDHEAWPHEPGLRWGQLCGCVDSVLTHLVDVNGFQGQLPQALSAVPVALRGGGHAPAPSFASRSVLKVHDAGTGALGDRKKPGEQGQLRLRTL